MGQDTSEEKLDLLPARRVLESHGIDSDSRKSFQTQELLIPMLQDIQEAYGYLPREVIEWVSDKTGIPTNHMYGVITFYTQFYLEKGGEHMIRCCQGTACHVKGAPLVVETIERELGIKAGETTPDGKFSLETVNCLGACALAPLMVVDEEYYGKIDQSKVQKILAEIREGS